MMLDYAGSAGPTDCMVDKETHSGTFYTFMCNFLAMEQTKINPILGFRVFVRKT